MVWAGISLDTKTEPIIIGNGTLTAKRYVNEIIEPHVIPQMRQLGGYAVFLHDNARVHVAKNVLKFIQEHNLQVIESPSRSPDLNPIEQVWDKLKQHVIRWRNVPPQPVSYSPLTLPTIYPC